MLQDIRGLFFPLSPSNGHLMPSATSSFQHFNLQNFKVTGDTARERHSEKDLEYFVYWIFSPD